MGLQKQLLHVPRHQRTDFLDGNHLLLPIVISVTANPHLHRVTILDLASHSEDMETEAQRFPQRDIISPCIPALSYMVATSHMRLFKFKMKN